MPSVVVGLIVGGKGSNLDRLRRLYGNTQVRIADRDEPWQLGTNRRRRIAFTGAPEAIDACIEDVKQTLAGQSAKTGLPHTIEGLRAARKGWPTDALSGPLGHRELSASIPAPFLPGAAAAAAAGGLNPATGLPHTAAYLKKAAAGVVPTYGPDGNAAVAAGTYGPSGMGAAPARPGDNRLPGQRLVDALYDWLVANNRDGIDPTFMTEFRRRAPGHRAKSARARGLKGRSRSSAEISCGGPTRRAARAMGEWSWWVARRPETTSARPRTRAPTALAGHPARRRFPPDAQVRHRDQEARAGIPGARADREPRAVQSQ